MCSQEKRGLVGLELYRRGLSRTFKGIAPDKRGRYKIRSLRLGMASGHCARRFAFNLSSYLSFEQAHHVPHGEEYAEGQKQHHPAQEEQQDRLDHGREI